MKNDRSVRSAIGAFRFSLFDVGAIILVAAFAVYHVYLAHIGFHNPDETFYLTTAQRLLLGDSLIRDEWGLTQFSSLFQLIPLYLYERIAGTTEGIVLYFRLLFVAVHSLFGIFLYYALRSDKGTALFSLVLYLSFIPWLTLSLSYYYMSIIFTIYIGIRLFVRPAKAKIQKLFCGVVYALIVLAEPLTVILYPIYTGMVVFYGRKKDKQKDGDFRSKTFWIWATIGIALTVVLFFAFLFSRMTVHEWIEAVPNLFQDSEYPMDHDVWRVFTRFMHKGIPPFTEGNKVLRIGMLLLIPVAAAVLAYTHKLHYRNVVVAISALFMVFLLYLSYRQWLVGQYLLSPFAWLGLVCGLLTEQKKQKFFAFFWLGLLFAFLLHVSSDCEQGLGIVIPAIVCPQLCMAFANEMSPAFSIRRRVGNIKTLQRRKRTAAFFEKIMQDGAKPLIAVCLGAVLMTQGLYLICECRGDYFIDATLREATTERKPGVVYDAKLRRGPYRGITTTKERAELYEDILQDLDAIRTEMGADDTFYIADLLSWGYLYMNVSVYTPYSTYFVSADLETRQFEYWDIHPEKTPDYIYIPDVVDPWYETDEAAMQKTLQVLQNRFICQTTEGKRGYILRVTGMQ